ncbi:MAG: uL30 family ribosomal protein [Candidatus Aenigmarchaeota archaeon]|nr:uL30 family ribosomal protein [Candidatus Aenigmarchaeota archaeon]
MTFAVVRLRGSVNVNKRLLDTLTMLNLKRVNHCVLVPDNPSYKGMLKKVESFITWGEVSKEIEQTLKKKGEGPIFRLTPPSHGLKSTKVHFPKGDLGYRGKAINDLLRRMV